MARMCPALAHVVSCPLDVCDLKLWSLVAIDSCNSTGTSSRILRQHKEYGLCLRLRHACPPSPPPTHTTTDTRTATPRQTHSHPSHAVDTAIVESQLAENGGRLPGNLQSGAVIASFSLPIGSAFGKPFERSGRKMRRSSSLVLHHEVAAHPSTCCGYALRMVAWLHLRHAFCFCCGELIAVVGF